MGMFKYLVKNILCYYFSVLTVPSQLDFSDNIDIISHKV